MRSTNFFVKNLFFVLTLFSIVLLISCKKDKSSDYNVTFTKGSTGVRWESEKSEALIINDSLIIRGNKKDGSSIAIVVANSYPGIYTIDMTNLESLIIINEKGGKESASNYLSVEGSVTIDDNNTKDKTVKGYFNIQAAKPTSITERENITGTFNVKYKKY